MKEWSRLPFGSHHPIDITTSYLQLNEDEGLSTMPLRIAVLLSGGGTTLQNLLRVAANGDLSSVEFALVISSRRQARGLDFATSANIPTAIVRRRDFDSGQAHSDHLFRLIREHSVQLVVMAGYLEHLLIPPDFEGRVINIHPSLIPAFSGHGFYGLRVHQAAIDYGVKLSGCTVHFVDNHYDHGPIIAQRACPVMPDDTAEELQRRVFALECQLFPDIIRAIAAQEVQLTGRQVRLTSPTQ